MAATLANALTPTPIADHNEIQLVGDERKAHEAATLARLLGTGGAGTSKEGGASGRQKKAPMRCQVSPGTGVRY